MNKEEFSAAVSYSLGVVIANNLKNQVKTEDIDMAQVALGLEDMLKGKDLAIDLDQAGQIVQQYFQTLATEQSGKAKEEGVEFLAENAKREEVTVTASGLQYEIIREGKGAKPALESEVVAHYEGRLINGTVFDSSIERGEPATFPVNALIKGWQEALQLMPQGSRWRLFIPYDLAYGERGAGNDIPPFSALVFELELIQINS